jgi:endonuclease/exonuclease/phosphatase family metal-dependent hydrolase
MQRRVLAIGFAAPWVVWALVRTFGLDGRHPIVGAMAYTPYVALSSPLPVLVALALRRWAATAVAAVAAIALVGAVAPRAFAGSPQAHGPRLVVMTANLYVGRGDAAAVMRLVRERHVDVLSLQELTPEELARLDAAGAATVLPGRSVAAGPDAAGTGLLARLPLRPVAAHDPEGAAEPEAILDVPGAPPVHLKAVHPLPPINASRVPLWQATLRALPGSDGRGDVRILAGDFNATLDHHELRRVLGRGYDDAADAAGEGLRPTWPALPRHALPITIDHVLLDRRVAVRGVSVVRIPGSDHRALIVELTLPAGGG